MTGNSSTTTKPQCTTRMNVKLRISVNPTRIRAFLLLNTIEKLSKYPCGSLCSIMTSLLIVPSPLALVITAAAGASARRDSYSYLQFNYYFVYFLCWWVERHDTLSEKSKYRKFSKSTHTLPYVECEIYGTNPTIRSSQYFMRMSFERETR
uniref:Uncharacterized protein n=1 Tax=Glossina brevipalpis TaxID=37001 RepID=A0A1A9WXE8_9MUSC